MTTVHSAVLLHETIDALDPTDGGVFLDATLGGAGHTEALLKASSSVSVIAFDADPAAIARARERLASFEDRVTYVNRNFRHAEEELSSRGVVLTGALFDLGLSSDELEGSGRGFSFRQDEPLHMGFDPKQSLTATDLLAHVSAEGLAQILRVYGEERYAKRIAEAIVEARTETPITTTAQLRELIEKNVPFFYRKGRIHPATRTFQALRIAVNDEYDALREGLHGAWKHLKEGGRLAVISFHSGEDRIVKQFMKELEKDGFAQSIFKKPLTASAQELAENPRSRSAKLRACIKHI
jgi:16S rRNA (cytosine1402-N4)-methyltransferase